MGLFCSTTESNANEWVPPMSYTVADCRCADAFFSSPGRYWLCDAVNGKHHVAGFVSLLLRKRNPTAIIWFIVTVVVDTIKSLLVRSFSHVGKKVREVVPSITDDYTASAVIMKCLAIRVFAAIMHGLPRCVRPCQYIGCVAMRRTPGDEHVPGKTAARFCVTRPQLGGANGGGLPAIAFADPLYPALSGFDNRPLDDKKSAESKSCKIIGECHASNLTKPTGWMAMA